MVQKDTDTKKASTEAADRLTIYRVEWEDGSPNSLVVAIPRGGYSYEEAEQIAMNMVSDSIGTNDKFHPCGTLERDGDMYEIKLYQGALIDTINASIAKPKRGRPKK